MENCPFEPRLSAYYDHELDAETARLIADHLGGCSHCSDELKSMQRVSRLMAADTNRRLSPFGLSRLHRLADEVADNSVDRGWSLPLLRPLLAVAASVLVIAGAWLVELPGHRSTESRVIEPQPQAEWEHLAMGGHVEFPGFSTDSTVADKTRFQERFQEFMINSLKSDPGL